ncbi:MAG: transcription initiation factor IIB family protein [Candidatus Verstraetearchaeota archaeon]|nr:transcription initiation factor IIB family protein [Candidatus Verstraetearchaeota archaeon]
MKCSLCGSEQLISDKGELICRNCGLVIEDHSCDFYRYHLIKNNDEIIKNKKEERVKVIRLKKLALISRGYEERVLRTAINELNRLVSKLNIPNFIKDEALTIFKKVRKIKKRLPIKATIVASLYVACKINGIPRTLDEMIDSCDKKDVWRVYKYIIMNKIVKNTLMEPEAYLSKICSSVGADEEVFKKSLEIIRKTKEYGLLNGRVPYKFAAAVVYYAALILGRKLSQSKIAKSTHVSEVTIRNIVRKISSII